MKKVIFVPGTKIDFCTYLNDLQDYSFENSYKQVSPFVDQYGVVTNTISGGALDASDTALKITAGSINQITVGPGYGITISGYYISWAGGTYSLTPTSGTSIGTAGSSTVYYIYVKFSPVFTAAKPKVAGFLYDPSTNYVNTKQTYQTTFTTLNPGASGILIASGLYNASTDSIWHDFTDLRVPFRLKQGILSSEVFRRLGLFKNIGGLWTNSLVVSGEIYNAGKATYYTQFVEIYASGNTDLEVTYNARHPASGLGDAISWRHRNGSEQYFTNANLYANNSLILTNAGSIARTSQTTASAYDELSRLFRHGIINFNGRLDGSGDYRVVTTPIPSKPGTPTGLSATLLQTKKDSTYSMDLNAAMLTYQVAELTVNNKQNVYDLVSDFYDEVQRVNIEQGATYGGTMSGLYNYSGTVYIGSLYYEYPTYRYTLKSAASGLVAAGYVSGLATLGFDPVGGTYASGQQTSLCTARLSQLLTTTDAEIDTAVSNRMSASNAVLARSARADLNRDWVRTTYKCRISWTAPALINSEKIKYYHIRLYKLDPNNQSGVPSGISHLSLTTDFTKVIDAKEDYTHILRTTYTGLYGATASDNSTVSGWGSYSGIIIWDTALSITPRLGDLVSVGSENFYITNLLGTSGLQLDRYSASLIGKPSYTIYRFQLEDDASINRYDFDIYADQYYAFYVRAISQYDIAGDYTPAFKVTSNNLIAGTSNLSLRDLVSVEEQQFAQIDSIKSQVLKDRFSDQIKTLQRQVADTPRRDNLETLISTVRDLQTSS